MTRQVCDEDKSRDDMAGNSSSSAAAAGGVAGGFSYSDNNNTATVLVREMEQGFVTDPEMFNLATGIEMIGFSKTTHSNNNASSPMWNTLFGKSSPPAQHHHHHQAGPSSSNTINNDSSSTTFYPPSLHHHHQYNNNNRHQDFTSGISDTTSSENNNNNLIVGAAPHHHDSSSSAPTWQQDHSRMLVDDSSSFRCVFPCEGNERPSQGLSLSLSSNNPSTIGLQSFELRQTGNHNHHQMVFQEQGYLNPPKGSANLYQGHFLLRNSKFLVPAQDLLNEFCSLETRQSDVMVKQKNKQCEDQDNYNGGTGSAGSSKKLPLSSLEFVELQKRKTKLLAMLQEVDRRYKHYCSQMRMVVSSFEAVAGNGAATVYSALALKAMSRHFRCLKDGIMDQIQRTRKGMGEKDTVAAAGTTRGETPRLRVIDQALRQQRAFQQMSMMETHPWRPQRGLPERSVSLLRAWLFEHFLHPYPSDVDKHILARQTGLSRSQVSNWFINARVRLWKPMVEEMYLEEAKENYENNMASSDGGNTDDVQDHHSPNSTRLLEDHKPSQARLLRIDSECVSSIIINNPDYKDDPIKSRKTIHNMIPSHQDDDDQQFGFGSIEIDFSSYDDHHHSTPGMVSYNNSSDHNNGNHHHQGFNGTTGAVSLTLGLQQHGGNNGGVSLAFPPPATQGSMFYSREHIDECQPVVQYSLLDGEGQSMPYRNLMGTQLLHDLAN